MALAALTARAGYAQDKTKEPKVVLELEKPAPSENSAATASEGTKGLVHSSTTVPFGKTQRTFRAPKDGYRSLDGTAGADLGRLLKL